jgi:hypothetical protein
MSIFAEAEQQANERNSEVVLVAVLLPVALIEEAKQLHKLLGRSKRYDEYGWRKDHIIASERLEKVYEQLYQWLKELPRSFQKELFTQIDC